MVTGYSPDSGKTNMKTGHSDLTLKINGNIILIKNAEITQPTIDTNYVWPTLTVDFLKYLK